MQLSNFVRKREMRVNSDEERCPSGLRSTLGKRVYGATRTRSSNLLLSARRKSFMAFNVIELFLFAEK